MLGLIEPVRAVLIEQHLMIAVRIADGMEVVLANRRGVVARFSKSARLFERIACGHARHAEHPVTPWR